MLKEIFICFVIALFYFSTVKAQDKIILQNGDTIYAIFNKLTPNETIYRNLNNPDSIIKISNYFVRKIIRLDGSVLFVEHLGKPFRAIIKKTYPDGFYVNGNSYYFNGVRIYPHDLKKIYNPLHDSLLNDMYLRAIHMKHFSSFLKFAPIPIGGVGYALVIYSLLPNGFPSEGPLFDKDFAVPGFLLLGNALISGIGGIITYRTYKKLLRKSATRYIDLNNKHELN